MFASRRKAFGEGVLGALFCAAVLIYVVLFFLVAYLSLLPIPILDLMDWAVFYLQSKASGWGTYLWQAHNEHRIAFARLLVAADIELFRGSGITFFISGLICFLTLAWLLLREICAGRLPPGWAKSTAAIVIFILAAAHLAVFISVPSLAGFLQTATLVVLALLFMDPQNNGRNAGRRAASLICAVLAPFGVSAGLLVWPALLWTGWRGGVSAIWLGAIFLLGGLESIVYLHGLPSALHSAASLTAPLNMADYSVRVLGLPWSHAPGLVWFGRLSGCFSMLAGGYLLAKTTFQAERPHRLQRIGAALIVFGILTAGAAGFARFDFAPERETPIRYGIIAAMVQIGIVFCAAELAAELYDKASDFIKTSLAKTLAVCVVSVLLLQQAVSARVAISAESQYFDNWRLFKSGQWTPAMEHFIYPSKARANFALDLFRKEHLYSTVDPVSAPQ